MHSQLLKNKINEGSCHRKALFLWYIKIGDFMYKQRQQKVWEKMKEKGIDQLIISDPLCIYYLTSHYVEPDERFMCVLFSNDSMKFFVNRLFEIHDQTLDIVDFDDYEDPIQLISQYIETGNLAVDKMFPAKFLIPILKSNSIQDINVTEILDELRMIKDEYEIQKMKEASQLNDEAMLQMFEFIQEGITEKELEQHLLQTYIQLGAQDFSFDPIVSFGKNTSDTHHTPDQTPLKKGDCIMLDMGCRKDMYCSDMTRMFFYGYQPDAKQIKIYDIVREAYETGEKMCRPGVRLADIDLAVRKVIEDAGYGDCFKHRTGHMIGLETHDFGEVSKNSDIIAKPGMIFSIEPTIMLEDYTIHFENLVLITPDGHETLNKVTYDRMIK